MCINFIAQQNHCTIGVLLYSMQMSNPRKLKIGSPATGHNFYPRNDLRRRILRALSRDHVAFLGPRRTGKTSILLDIAENPPEGILAINLDLQGLRSIPAWLKLMLDATKRLVSTLETGISGYVKTAGRKAWGITSSAASSVLKRIDELTIAGNGIKLNHGQPAVDDWQPIADGFLALLKEHQLPIYFLLDEFPWFLGHVAANHSTAEVDAALNWFRKMRLELTDMQARFLVTGSIGLTGLLRRLNLHPSANDFDEIEIEPLTSSEAIEFMKEFAAGEGIPVQPSEIQQIYNRIGVGWPILLATFLSEIQEHCTSNPVTSAEIDDIYENRMVRGTRNKYCTEMMSRLSKDELFTPSERRLAQEILKQLARETSPFGSNQLEGIHARLVPDSTQRLLVAVDLDVVVETLLHDGYIIRLRSEDPEQDGRLRFASNILRDFWRYRTV